MTSSKVQHQNDNVRRTCVISCLTGAIDSGIRFYVECSVYRVACLGACFISVRIFAFIFCCRENVGTQSCTPLVLERVRQVAFIGSSHPVSQRRHQHFPEYLNYTARIYVYMYFHARCVLYQEEMFQLLRQGSAIVPCGYNSLTSRVNTGRPS